MHPQRHVIVLNGPPAAGKSTVGRLLAGRVDNGACVHGDALSGFIVTHQPAVVDGRLGYLNAASVASNFIKGGYERVVIDSVFEHRAHLDHMFLHLQEATSVHVFLLWAPLDVLLRRHEERQGSEVTAEHIRACHARMATARKAIGTMVDTSRRSPAEVAQHLDALVRRSLGPPPPRKSLS